jgi:DNA-binding IclR family transcriptional regulator
MPRHTDQTHLDALSQAIAGYPGKRAGFFARLLNWPREQVHRRLVTLNDQGVLLWEDERGGLRHFDKRAI